MRRQLQHLKNNVEGRTIFILGGGTSVTPSILQFLNEKRNVFCLNSSSKFIDDPIGILWCDNSWISNNLEYVKTLECPKIYVMQNGDNHIRSNLSGIGNSIVIGKQRNKSFSSDINYVCGNNSGAYAINLLSNCKAKTIGLIGFDMYAESNKAHFHSEYTYSIRPSIYSSAFVPAITAMANEITNSGMKINIYNCNPRSALKCFEYKDYKDIK